jgi:predicted acetyltransferase
MTAALTLVRPSAEHAGQIAALRAEFLAEVSHIPGGSRLEDFDDPAAWIDHCAARADPTTVPQGWVQGDQWLLTEPGGILGLVNVRHSLGTEYLAEYGGHIGYAIRPTERGHGYGHAQLMLALDWCRTIGLDKVLLTCDATNEASRRTIISCGGIYERDTVDPSRGETMQRYWIAL